MARAPADPLSAAARVSTQQQAARLYWTLENELAAGTHDQDWKDDALEAQGELASDWGGHNQLRQLGGQQAPHGGRRRPAPPKQPVAKQPALSTGTRTSAPPAPARSGRAPSSPRKPAPRTARPAPRSSGRIPGRRAFRQTGIPAAAGSTTAFALQTLGLMIGMALLYLVLSDAERARKGAGIFGTVLTGATSMLHRLVSPTDPLSKASPPPTSAAGVPILQRGESNAHFDQRMNDYLRSRLQPAPPDTSAGAVVGGTARPIGGFPATTP
jgi:hypothetical protein